MTIRFLVAFVLCVCVAPLSAQQPVAAQPPDAQPVQSVAAPVIAVMPTRIALGSRVGELTSGYDSGGRRDPFSSLVAERVSRTDGAPAARPPAGLAGIALADVNVRGIVRSGTTTLAILEGPNRQSFVSRVNDRLLDATIVRIDADGVIFGEQVERGAAPNHLRKALRPAGDLAP